MVLSLTRKYGVILAAVQWFLYLTFQAAAALLLVCFAPLLHTFGYKNVNRWIITEITECSPIPPPS